VRIPAEADVATAKAEESLFSSEICFEMRDGAVFWNSVVVSEVVVHEGMDNLLSVDEQNNKEWTPRIVDILNVYPM
jgi:hypothetical protein